MVLFVTDDGSQRTRDGEALLQLGVLKENVDTIVVSAGVSLPECYVQLDRLSRREIDVALDTRREA